MRSEDNGSSHRKFTSTGGLRTPRTQWITFVLILTGYWTAWARYPVAGPFAELGAAFVPLLKSMGVLLAYWLILLWMYQRRIFLKL